MKFVSFFDLKDRNQLEQYFKMKSKHDFSFDEKESEKFILECITRVKQYDYDFILVPDTKNKCLLEIAKQLDPHYLQLKKNTPQEILNLLQEQKMMKDEFEKLSAAVKAQDVLQINKIAGNQRKRFIPLLFKALELPSDKKVLLLDDAVFGGSTLDAASYALNREPDQCIVLFSKANALEIDLIKQRQVEKLEAQKPKSKI